LSYKKRERIAPYKSTLEYKVAKEILTEYEYEPIGTRVAYSIPHEYVPDFIHRNQPDILIEVKGYMVKGHSDCQKYISVQRDNPNKELIFIFSDPYKRAYPQCRVRKDGSVLTLAEWCKGNNFLFFKTDSVPVELCQGLWGVSEVREYKRRLYGN